MTRATCPACAEMRTNANRKHTSAELQAYHPLRFDFEKATNGLAFTKVFNLPLEADIHDPLATIGQRVWAYYLRMSWGNYCLYCVTAPDGEPVGQVDCAAALQLERNPGETDEKYKSRGKALVSKATCYFESRGRLRREGRLIYPLSRPVAPPIVTRSGYFPDYKTFVAQWRVTHSSTFAELEVARSTVKKIRKVILSDYKQLLASETKPAAYKEESFESSENKAAAAAPMPAEPAAAAAPPDPPEPQPDAITPILTAFAPHHITDSQARRLLRDSGGATAEEVGAKASELIAAINPKNPNPGGVAAHIRTNQLPQFFHSPAALAMWRREREEKAAADTQANRRAEEYQRERQAELARMAESPPEDPESARARLRKMRGESV